MYKEASVLSVTRYMAPNNLGSRGCWSSFSKAVGGKPPPARMPTNGQQLAPQAPQVAAEWK